MILDDLVRMMEAETWNKVDLDPGQERCYLGLYPPCQSHESGTLQTIVLQ